MKKFYPFIAILLLSIIIYAQPATTQVSDKSRAVKDDTNINPRLKLSPEKAAPVNVPKIAAPPSIDGKVDEEIWQSAAVFKDFIQTGPGDNIAPSKPTEAYLLYDEKNLYVAFKCWDEPDKIRATVAKRDNVFGEDNVRMWLDTYDDQRRAYVFGCNPLGIQQDGIYTENKATIFRLIS